METALLQVKSKDIQNFGAKTKDPALLALPLGSRPLPLHPSAEKSQSLRGFPKQPSVRWKSKGQNPEFWPAGPALLLALALTVCWVLLNERCGGIIC